VDRLIESSCFIKCRVFDWQRSRQPLRRDSAIWIYLFEFICQTFASIHRMDSPVGSDVSVGHSACIFRAI
jgi:hypothetical protein